MRYSTVQPGDREEGDEQLPVTLLESPSCGHDACITCSDSAPAARVVELLPGGLARVERDGALETVNLELVEAGVGDLVLVHAGVVIGKLEEDTSNGSSGG